ncbi:MAG: metalloregulator ArsR/SmtB family transcription factor [Candidatus Altiarchaeia archaeon]|jgi:ArsR family transcriptional regulator
MNPEKQAKLFKALGDPTRLLIVAMLLKGEQCVCRIIPDTGKSQPTVSAHLKILNEAGIVKFRRDGLSVYYFLADEKIKELLSISKRIKET